MDIFLPPLSSQDLWEYSAPFLLGFVFSGVVTWLSVLFFPRLGLLDFPHRYGLHRPRIPYPGGIGLMGLACGIALFDAAFWVLIPFLLVGMVLNVWDDRMPLPALPRLIFHLGLASALWWVGVRINFIGNPFADTNIELSHVPIISFALTVFWILAVQNALNWFDGIKGLAPGVTGVAFLALGALGLMRPELFYDPQHTSLTVANLYLAGVALGGLLWYLRGSILLGDTGAQGLGFLLAVMAIFSGAKIATTVLVLALPLIDFVLVIGRRIFLEKKSPFSGDQKHLHHKMAATMGEGRAAMVLIGLSALYGAVAAFVQGREKLLALSIVTLCTLVVIALAWKSDKKRG